MASEAAVVLPPIDTLPLADVPNVHPGVLREAEQLARAVFRPGPPERADGSVSFESGDDLGCAGAPVDEVNVSTTAGDGENVAGRVEGADVHAPVLVGAKGGSP